MYNPMKIIQKRVDRRIDIWLRKLNFVIIDGMSSPNRLVRERGVPVLFAVRRMGIWLRRIDRYRIYRVTGLEQSTGKPLTIIYIVEGKSMEYLHHLVFEQDTVAQQQLGTCLLWEVPQVAKKHAPEADMVVLEGDQSWTPREGEWIKAPSWIRMVFKIREKESWEQIQLRLKAQYKNIRKVQKAGFTSHISTSDADFEHFYECMHVPLILKRHKNYGLVENKETLYKFFKRGFLSLVKDPAGRVVGGDILVQMGKTLWACSTGVLDGDQELINAGVQSALYYYTFKIAAERGAAKIDVGECRPFENDGIYIYKSRWGFEPEIDPWQPRRLVFWVPTESQVARSWLDAHPFLNEFSERGRRENPQPVQLRSLSLEPERRVTATAELRATVENRLNPGT